jgi:hypothetical protein
MPSIKTWGAGEIDWATPAGQFLGEQPDDLQTFDAKQFAQALPK